MPDPALVVRSPHRPQIDVYLGRVSVVSAPAAIVHVDPFAPSADQTAFSLSAVPTQATTLVMHVNGQAFTLYSGAFTLSGSTVTWTAGYPLGPVDTVTFQYS